MTTVLVLCHGNRYRSPLAGAALRRWFPSLAVETAGFNPATVGYRAASCIRRWAADVGLADLAEHRARLCTVDLVRAAEYVLYMDRGQRQRLAAFGEVTAECLGAFYRPPRRRIPDLAWLPAGSAAWCDVAWTVLRCARGFGMQELGLVPLP